MLQELLPRIPWQRGWSFLLQCEAWAFTQLAYYAAAPFPQRVNDSFKRAYDQNSIARFPGVVNGRPNFLIAHHDGGADKRMVIAIEGMTSWGQILNLVDSISNVAYSNFSGRAYGTFANYANDIWTMLHADPTFQAKLAGDRTPILVTGHSMGAAIAHLLAARFARTYPEKEVTCYKFGSPKVGDSAFVNSTGAWQTAFNIYCQNDPIAKFPCFAPVRSLVGLNPYDVLFVDGNGFLALCGNEEYWDEQCYQAGRERESIPTDFIHALASLRHAMDASNDWYYHDRNSYRLMMSEGAFRTIDHNGFRFLHLEYPDQNSWGVNFRPVRGIQPDMLLLLNPPPASVASGYVVPTRVGIVTPAPRQYETLPAGVPPVRGQFGTQRRRRGHVVN